MSEDLKVLETFLPGSSYEEPILIQNQGNAKSFTNSPSMFIHNIL